MGFKSFSSKLILRIAGICVTSFLLTHFLYTDNIVFVPLTAGALVYQAYLLKKWIGATHHTVTEYLNAIQGGGDLNQSIGLFIKCLDGILQQIDQHLFDQGLVSIQYERIWVAFN